MSVVSVFFLLIIMYTNTIYGIITTMCNDTECNIIPSSNNIIICSNKVSICNIICNNKDECKNKVTIYSSALNTKILCLNENSCTSIKLFIGQYKPNNINIDIRFNDNDFIGILNSFNMICTGHSSCKSTELNIKGNFINGVNIYTNGTGTDKFAISKLNCNIHENQECNLFCQIPQDCYNTQFKCIHGNCYCDNCAHVIKDTQIPTKSTIYPTKNTYNPTIITAYPTNTPTNNPSISPTKTPSSSPTLPPTKYISKHPSITPTVQPTWKPTSNPTPIPTRLPTENPTIITTVYVTSANESETEIHSITSITPTISPTDEDDYIETTPYEDVNEMDDIILNDIENFDTNNEMGIYFMIDHVMLICLIVLFSCVIIGCLYFGSSFLSIKLQKTKNKNKSKNSLIKHDARSYLNNDKHMNNYNSIDNNRHYNNNIFMDDWLPLPMNTKTKRIHSPNGENSPSNNSDHKKSKNKNNNNNNNNNNDSNGYIYYNEFMNMDVNSVKINEFSETDIINDDIKRDNILYKINL